MPLPHRALDGLNHVRRWLETEGRGIADIEVSDTGTGRLDGLRLGYDVAYRVQKRLTREAIGIDRAVRESGIILILRLSSRQPAPGCNNYTHYPVHWHYRYRISKYCSKF